MFFGQPFGGVVPGVRGAVLATLLRTGAPVTGRQLHAMIKDDYSLSTVQEELRVLRQLGLITTETVGRAGLHRVNEDHVSVPHLRGLLDPISALIDTVRTSVDSSAKSVILFGSVARGEATDTSDIDLVVVAPADWAGRLDLQDSVRSRLGNSCDVLVLTPDDFAGTREPVVGEIIRDGIALIGVIPRIMRGVA